MSLLTFQTPVRSVASVTRVVETSDIEHSYGIPTLARFLLNPIHGNAEALERELKKYQLLRDIVSVKADETEIKLAVYQLITNNAEKLRVAESASRSFNEQFAEHPWCHTAKITAERFAQISKWLSK